MSTAGRHLRLCAARRRAQHVIGWLMLAALMILAWTMFAPPDPRVIYNPSESVPIGWYRIQPWSRHASALQVDTLVLIWLPPEGTALAAQRGYLPTHVPALKRIGAIAPQQVCVRDGRVLIDDVPVAELLAIDGLGRALPAWPGCRALVGDELFLLSATHPASFDSRYFGPAHASAVLGVAHPLSWWVLP